MQALDTARTALASARRRLRGVIHSEGIILLPSKLQSISTGQRSVSCVGGDVLSVFAAPRNKVARVRAFAVDSATLGDGVGCEAEYGAKTHW
jgi:hypothetical protein